MLTGIDIEDNELSLNIFSRRVRDTWTVRTRQLQSGQTCRKLYLQCGCLKRHILANDFHNEKMFIPSVKLKYEGSIECLVIRTDRMLSRTYLDR